MKFYSVAFSMHRFLGTLISLLFLMWFISGLIFIYHPFPNVNKQQIYEKKEALPKNLPPIDSLLKYQKKSSSKLKLFQFQGQTLLEHSDDGKSETYSLKGKRPLKPNFLNIANNWVQAPIVKIDTLTEREQWIMYSRYNRVMPIYKFYFDDNKRHQLYIASKTGEVQQFTNKKQRFWAWLGPIPHKLYFSFLRKNTEVWKNTLTILATISFFAILMGLFLGIKFYLKEYLRNHHIKSPYKKPWHLWHHVTGTLFGIFLLGWAFSGAMALQRIPQWLVKTKGTYDNSRKNITGKELPLKAYKLDYREVIKTFPNVKQIAWKHFQKKPFYEVIIDNRLQYIDASCNQMKDLYLSKVEIERTIKGIYDNRLTVSTIIMKEYDNYYLSLNNTKPLPVYKVSVNDTDNSTYYFDPLTGDYKYVNDNRRAKKWMFSALHYFSIKFFADKPLAWTFTIWFLCIGGIIVCVSGVSLSLQYLKRKIIRIKRK